MPSPTAEPEIGSLVHTYRIERLVGRGGFGSVFAARSTTDGTQVALKILSRRMLEQVGGVARFRREAELARRLQHPNVVRVIDAGEDGGTQFIAFELLEGRSLEAEISRWGAMPPARAVRMAMEVLSAIEAAHALGIVHRDLKPANVFILHEQDRIKVLDFGIAKSLAPATLAALTQEGVAIGTPAYMAPEQVVGGAVGPATDLFAVGILLTEMLSGRPLYDERSSPIDILRERLAARPVPLPPGVASLAVAPILERAVRPRPEERFASAAEMRSALAALLPSLQTAPIGPIVGAAPATASVGFAPTRAPGAWTAPGWAPTTPPTPGWAPTAPPTPGWAPTAPPTAPPSAAAFGALAPVGVYPLAASPSRSPPRGTPWGWIIGIIAAALVALGGVLAGAFYLVTFRVPAGADIRTPDAGSAIPPPETPDSIDGVVRACSGVATLDKSAMTSHLGALGWAVTGESLHCFGDMVNLQCKGPSARGVTAERGDQEGDIAIVRLGSQREVDAFVADARDDGAALGVGSRAVLIVDLPAADATKLLDRVCR